ncbi:hypothetical protein [Cellulomonas sp. S1-8]|uniref:hypothetical protein n=1 Tax=Cellulomonas sp. S1-8 TaxID=2904790 RepID=UPI002243F96E|nr:hypothetical protein [Cellulomonas sp. S1-8]UZN01935.1 hypothetical protein OKX07_12655 [Cellulomonas sp. S1-8]
MTALLPRTTRLPSPPAERRRTGHRAVPAVLLVAAGLVLGACTTGTPSATAPPTSGGPTSSATPSATGTPSGGPSPSASADAPATDDPGTDPAPTPDEPAPPAATVDVVVTFSGWNALTSAAEVGAYAATLSPGTCTLRLTGPGGATAEVTAATFADATTVSCSGLAVPREQLSSGTWTGVVEYVGPNASGRTDVPPMDIP